MPKTDSDDTTALDGRRQIEDALVQMSGAAHVLVKMAESFNDAGDGEAIAFLGNQLLQYHAQAHTGFCKVCKLDDYSENAVVAGSAK